MMKYKKIIILSSVLLVLIILITLAMVFDVDFKLFKNLSIAGIKVKKADVESRILENTIEQINNMNEKTDLQSAKNEFDIAKQKYENVDDSTIAIIEEATKEDEYFIEYLWIVLGNYASINNVSINILTPGSVNITTENSNSGENATNNQTTTNETQYSPENGIKITVQGRYANIADFVFDVENDKSLRFKLDNIKMTYSGDNKVKATFDILSLSVLK